MKLHQKVELKIFDDYYELTDKLVEDFLDIHQNSANRMYLLPGGKTPGLFFNRIADKIPDWNNTTIILTDERDVKDTDDRSNTRFINERLIGKISNNRPDLIQYPLPNSGITFDMANSKIKRILLEKDIALTLLGLGEDGHFASLFPPIRRDYFVNGPLLQTNKLYDEINRISLTYPIFLESKQIWFLVSGPKKAKVLEELLFGGNNARNYPAYTLIENYSISKIRFYCDKESAKFLKGK